MDLRPPNQTHYTPGQMTSTDSIITQVYEGDPIMSYVTGPQTSQAINTPIITQSTAPRVSAQSRLHRPSLHFEPLEEIGEENPIDNTESNRRQQYITQLEQALSNAPVERQYAAHQPSRVSQRVVPLSHRLDIPQSEPIRRNNPIEYNYYPPQMEEMAIQAKPRDTFLRRLRCIPKFNGESYAQLKEFMEVSESLYISCDNEAEETEFYQQMLLQLRGEARTVVTSINNPDWEKIKGKLLKYFSYLSNKEILTSQLENARQEENESLNAFADRVRRMLREKNATYSFMTEDQKQEINRMARKSFSKGVLNRSLRNRLVTRGTTSLEDAIAYAIEAENDSINDISPTELYCRKCDRSGHRFKDSKNANNDNSEMNRLISALRSLSNQNRPNQNRNNTFPNGMGRLVNASALFNRAQNQNNFTPNRNWNNQASNGNNFIPNRNWSNNNFSPNRTWNNNNNNFPSNRNWNSNNSAPNGNWNNSANNRNWNNSMPNRNWNSNNSSPNGNNRNWNQNQGSNWSNRNNGSNGAPSNNQSQGPNTQGPNTPNRTNFGQQRQNNRQRQNNSIDMSNRSSPPMSSSSENPSSEN